jgi:hypothetical protein
MARTRTASPSRPGHGHAAHPYGARPQPTPRWMLDLLHGSFMR